MNLIRAFWIRSIPAHAGEPVFDLSYHWLRRVYPRPRGGTLLVVIGLHGVEGLSPPTRGNPTRGHRLAWG